MARPTLYYRNIEVYNNSDRLAPNVSCPFLFAAECGQDDPQYSRCSDIVFSCRLDQTGEAGKRVITSNNVTAKEARTSESEYSGNCLFNMDFTRGSYSSFIH